MAGVGELKAVADEIRQAGAYYLRRGRAWLRGVADAARDTRPGGPADRGAVGGAAGDGRVDGFIPGSYGYGGEGRHAVTEAVEEPRHDHHRAVDLAAEQLARAYRAQGLPSQRGRGPRGYTRADDRILDEINARLWDDPIVDASDIDVRCEQGRIVLEGHVPVRWMKHRAEDIADAVPGAKEVDNRIRVGAPDTDATATGAAAATQARSGESGIAAPMDRGAHGTAASSSSTGGPADATLPPLPQSPH